MRTTMPKHDVELLVAAQRSYPDAKRHCSACVGTVSRICRVSEIDAIEMLESGSVIEELDRNGLEVYDQRECGPWPDRETLAVWCMLTLGFGATWAAAAAMWG